MDRIDHDPRFSKATSLDWCQLCRRNEAEFAFSENDRAYCRRCAEQVLEAVHLRTTQPDDNGYQVRIAT